MPSTLVISRYLSAERATVSTECRAGRITILVDEMRTSLPAYSAALSKNAVNSATANVVRLTLDQQPYSVTAAATVGFQDEFPDLPVGEYLKTIGVPESTLAQLMKSYDLDRPEIFSCAQLSATPNRQLALLAAIYSPAPVVILNDPYQPFNGRWRDAFGELLLREVVEKNRIVVAINVSFVPPAWSKSDLLDLRDVGHAAVSAVERAKEMAIQEELARKRAAEEAARNAAALQKLAQKSASEDPAAALEIPEDLGKNYRPVYDYIFAPLAEMSEKFRQYGLVGSVFAGVFVIVLMAVILFPNMSHSRAVLSRVSASLNWTWGDVVDSGAAGVKEALEHRSRNSSSNTESTAQIAVEADPEPEIEPVAIKEAPTEVVVVEAATTEAMAELIPIVPIPALPLEELLTFFGYADPNPVVCQ